MKTNSFKPTDLWATHLIIDLPFKMESKQGKSRALPAPG